jgi:hypothetical protein
MLVRRDRADRDAARAANREGDAGKDAGLPTVANPGSWPRRRWIFSSVLLPAPLRPITPSASPWSRANDTSRSAQKDERDRSVWARRSPRSRRSGANIAAVRRGDGLLFLVHPSVLLHRPTVQAVGGYDPAFGAVADTELWSRVADAHQMLTVPEVLVRYRVHGASMSFARFFEQRRYLRWTQRRQTARRSGQPESSLDEHLAWEHGPLGLRWANHAWIDRAALLLRRTRVAAMNGWRARATLFIVATGALTPRSTVRRMVDHARRTHRQTGASHAS